MALARPRSLVRLLFVMLAAMMVPAAAQAAVQADAPRRLDLADIAQGEYFGSVISDARGSSRSDVRVTVTRIGPNRVRVTSDYARLPRFEIELSRAMDTIQQVGTSVVFLLDLAKSPASLDINVDDASWSGTKE